MSIQAAPAPANGWRWFPWAIAASIAAVVAVNGALLYFAKSTFPGVAATKPYEVGAAYNSVLADAARQEALGWRLTTSLEAETVVVMLVDRDGAPLKDLTVTGTIARPVGSDAVYPFSFKVGADGVYRADQTLPARGQWELKLAARDNGQIAFTAARRIVAP